MRPIRKIAIIGVGFMGGSLALALHKAFRNIYISGYARSKSSFDKLSKLNILDSVERDLEKVVSRSDIVVLALPIYDIIDYFKKIAPFLKDGAIVFDIGSSKELVEKAAKKYLPKNVYFVGCHPLCGSAKNGAQFAEASLYKNTICIITSKPNTYAVMAVKELWERLGAKVIFMPAAKHDKIISTLSHLTHLISFSITYNTRSDCLEFSPPSLKDLTRISGSPAFVWADIFLSNKANILRDINKFIQVLKKFEKLISGDKKKSLIELIEKVNKKQSALVSQHK